MDRTKRYNKSENSSNGEVGKAYKFLVIQQKMIGDVLTSSIICENLKKSFPDAEVHYMVYKFTVPVLLHNPYIDDIIIFEDEYKKSKLKFFKFLRQITTAKYTHVFDAYSKIESVLVSLFSKASYKYGLQKTYTRFWYTETISVSNNYNSEAGSAIENRLKLMQLLPAAKVYNNKPKIYLSKNEISDARKQFENNGLTPRDCIMISTLGSSEKKTYPLEYFGKVLDVIVDVTGKNLILNYMPSQQPYIDELMQYCNSKTIEHITKGIEMNSLRSFMAICSQCKAIVGNEGGAINMAKALDVPSFSIFSPWIIKNGWNSFEETYNNSSVHLSDYFPEKYTTHPKIYKDKALEMYQLFKPDLFKNQLVSFLKSL